MPGLNTASRSQAASTRVPVRVRREVEEGRLGREPVGAPERDPPAHAEGPGERIRVHHGSRPSRAGRRGRSGRAATRRRCRRATASPPSPSPGAGAGEARAGAAGAWSSVDGWGPFRSARERERCPGAGRRCPGGSRCPGGRRRGPGSRRRARRRAVEQLVPLEAGVAGAALRVPDLELRVATRRPVPVAGDLHGAPLAHHVPAQADPAGPAQLQAQAARLGDRGGEGAAERDGLEDDEQRAGPPRQRRQPAQPVPTRLPATAGSRPSGRSITSRSTVRAASSEPAIASASSRSCGVSTTSHSGLTPRVTASTGSNARARSSHATIAPPACASAATRSATVVRPDEAWPRSATVAVRGSPPCRGSRPARRTPWGRRGRRRPGRLGGTGPGDRIGAASGLGASSGSSSSGTGIGARASAPSTGWSSRSPPRRGAAEPQRAWSVASASETSDVRAIGRPILEQMFYSVKVLDSPA